MSHIPLFGASGDQNSNSYFQYLPSEHERRISREEEARIWPAEVKGRRGRAFAAECLLAANEPTSRDRYNHQLSTTPSNRLADQSRLASHPRLTWCPSFPFSSLLLSPTGQKRYTSVDYVTSALRRHFRGACQKAPSACTDSADPEYSP